MNFFWKYEFHEKEYILSLKTLEMLDSKEFIGITIGVYSDNEDQIHVNSKFLMFDISNENTFIMKKEINVFDEIIGDFFLIRNTLFICAGFSLIIRNVFYLFFFKDIRFFVMTQCYLNNLLL